MSKLQTPSSKIVNRNLLNQKSCPLNPILLYQETKKGIVFIICYDSIHCHFSNYNYHDSKIIHYCLALIN